MGDIVDFRPKMAEEEDDVFIALCSCEDQVPLDSIVSMDSGAPVVVGLQCAECGIYRHVTNGVVGVGEEDIH